jgi:hypothetical protein
MQSSPGHNINYENLKVEHGLLLDELAMLIFEREELVNTIGPNLQALYLKKVGSFQLEVFNLDFETKRLKRKIDLIQSYINKNLKPDEKIIDEQIEAETLDWKIQIDELAKNIKSAENHLSSLLTPADSREIKRIYRLLVRKLHPDVNAGFSAENNNLWMRIQKAYKDSDLNELRILELLLQDTAMDSKELNDPSRIDIIIGNIDRLKDSIRLMIDKIAIMRLDFPFNMEDKITSEIWLKAEEESLTKKKNELTHIKIQFEEYLANLLFGSRYGSFSPN